MNPVLALLAIVLSFPSFQLQAQHSVGSRVTQGTVTRQNSMLGPDSPATTPGAVSDNIAAVTAARNHALQGWALALAGSATNAGRSFQPRKGTGRLPRVVRGVSEDTAGGVFISGSFFGRAELEGFELASTGRSDVLVGRIDSAGQALWLRRFGGRGTDISPDIVADSNGRALVTGMTSNGARFGDRDVVTRGGSDAFTAQFSPQGEVQWVHTVGGAAADSGNEIAIDGEDNVLVAGNSYGSVTAGNTTLGHRGGMDSFVLKYNSLGQLLWVRHIAGGDDEQARGIAADQHGFVSVVGEFTGTINPGGKSLTAASENRDLYIARYTPDGELLWAARYGGPGEDYARGVDVDRFGNLYVTGVFSGAVEFGTTTVSSTGDREQLFVMRLSPAGEINWVRGLTGSGSGHGCEIDVNRDGYAVIACDVLGELSVDGMSVRSRGRRDSFVAGFDRHGKINFTATLGASKSAANFDVVADEVGRFATVVGLFEGSFGTGAQQVTAAADSSSYIVRIPLSGSASNVQAEGPTVSDAAESAGLARNRAAPARSRRFSLENPDPTYKGAPAGPHSVEELTLDIPAERWQQEMALRIYTPTDPGPFPVIIFCAGSGGENNTFPLTSRYLASHGYVVIHNSYVRQRGLGNAKLTRNRVLDVRLTLDSLDRLPGLEPRLDGKIRSDQVGAMGHSSGAYITQLLGGAVVTWDSRKERFREPRIRAILMYSGQGSGQQGLTRDSWRDLTIPMMAMTGSRDRGAFDQDPDWRREPFELSRGTGKYLLWYDRGHHGSFSGRFARNASTRALFEHAQEMTLAFFDAHVKSDSTALNFLASSQPQSLNSAPVEYHRR